MRLSVGWSVLRLRFRMKFSSNAFVRGVIAMTKKLPFDRDYRRIRLEEQSRLANVTVSKTVGGYRLVKDEPFMAKAYRWCIYVIIGACYGMAAVFLARLTGFWE